MFLYKTTIYLKPSDVAGLTSEEQTAHTNAKTDFETAGKKDEAFKVDSLQIAETTFEIEKDYNDFTELIVGATEWEDIKYEEQVGSYRLYLLSSEQL